MQKLGSSFNSKVAEIIMDKPKDLQIMCYLACRRFVIDEIKRYKNPYPYVTGLILQTTNHLVNVDVSHKERATGQSNYTLRKLFHLWLNGFTTFSIKPLRIATISGIIMLMLGMIGEYIGRTYTASTVGRVRDPQDKDQ